MTSEPVQFPLVPDPGHMCSMTFVEFPDIRVHYERSGTGAPVLLLHGGFASHHSWNPAADRLRLDHDVIAIDSRGQGRTSDATGPITYGRMAADVIRVLDALGIERTHVVGHSDGGCISLHLLVDHPDRLLTATLVGTPLHLHDYRPGMHAGLMAFIDALLKGGDDPFGFGEHYRMLSPHPERWHELLRKLGGTWRTQPVFTDAVLGMVEVPVLVVGVEHDEFLDRETFARTAAVFPRGEVAWIEEGTHALPMSHPEGLSRLIASFLEKVK